MSAVAPGATDESLVTVEGLRVSFGHGDDAVEVLHGVDFVASPGEMIGIVGESGSGKSTTVLALAGLLGATSAVSADRLAFAGHDLTAISTRDRRKLLGSDIGVIYQDALRALNPVMTVGDQVGEGLQARGVSRREARERSLEMLGHVGIADPRSRIDAYPHQLSGGMRQRVVIAMALIMRPSLLIADEPTTALDVTVQAQVLDLIADLSEEIGSTTLLVTHDLGVVAGTCDRVFVMYGGEVVEQGPVGDIFGAPGHPYTRALLDSVPDPQRRIGERLPSIPGTPPPVGVKTAGCTFADRCTKVHDACREIKPPLLALSPHHAAACLIAPEVATEARRQRLDPGPADARPSQASSDGVPLVVVQGVHRTYQSGGLLSRRRRPVRAVDGVDLTIMRGETIGLVGESGCGKSTLGKMLVGLEDPDEGRVTVDGETVNGLGRRERQAFRRSAQLIFQDPQSSLNRRMTVGQMLDEPLRARGTGRGERPGRIAELLTLVGLSPDHVGRYPHEFSGGQAQRIAVARALALEPRFLVADEAVSSLDVSIQGQILNLLEDLKTQLGLTLVFISHDLGVIRQICDRVAVMYLGQIVELGRTDTVFADPQHPYTLALRSAIPVPDPDSEWSNQRLLLPGDPPVSSNPPSGCRFHPRCPMGPARRDDRDTCRDVLPPLAPAANGGLSACHFSSEITKDLPT